MTVYYKLNNSNIELPTDIISVLNGKSRWYINNPYFNVKGVSAMPESEFLKFKNNRYVLSPNIYYKSDNNTFISNYALYLDNGENGYSTVIKIYSPYQDRDISKSRYYKSHITIYSDISNILKLEYYLSQGFEFLILAKILNINLRNINSDNQFIDSIAKLIKLDDKKIKILKHNIKNIDITFKGTNKKYCSSDIMTIIKKNLKDYIVENCDKDNLAKLFFKVTDEKALQPINPSLKSEEWEFNKGEEVKSGIHTIGNITLEFGKTLFKHNDNKIKNLDNSDFLNISSTNDGMYNARIIGTLNFDLRSYNSCIVTDLRFYTQQLGCRDFIKTNNITPDLDDNINNNVNNSDNGINITDNDL